MVHLLVDGSNLPMAGIQGSTSLTLAAEPGYSGVRDRFNDPLTPFFGSEGSRLGSNAVKTSR
jgi:hypothetical protein